LGYHDYEPKTSQASLAAGAYEHLLPKLCATGRFLWMLDSSQQVPEEDGRGLAWDDGPPWRFRLDIEADDKKERWLLEGQLMREGEKGPLPLKTPSLLLASGLVRLEDRLARLAVGDLFPWIAALRKASAIEVPYQDRCQSTLLLFLARYKDRIFDYLPFQGAIRVAIGKDHAELPKGTLLVGNCTAQHRHQGIFVAGCPPVQAGKEGQPHVPRKERTICCTVFRLTKLGAGKLAARPATHG
jgi:hypothetical protein